MAAKARWHQNYVTVTRMYGIIIKTFTDNQNLGGPRRLGPHILVGWRVRVARVPCGGCAYVSGK